MAKKIVTLFVNDTSLRLMVTDGKQIKEWAELPLEPGLVENAVVVKEAEFVARIKQLFEVQKITTRKVAVAISGFRCLTRPITLPQLPKEMLNEAVEREAERALPVPLGQLYLSWQTIPAPAEKTRVFLVAIPREIADALCKGLHKAGLSINLMNLKPLLLARIVTEATAIIVDVQTTEFDIVIMAKGVPQPVRTILFPGEAVSWQDKTAMINNELDRTITFYNSGNPENPLDATIPVFVSGEPTDEIELCQALSDEVGHPVLPLSSPLDWPEGFVPSRYMVNIGLALQQLSSRKKAGASAVSLNILPVPYQPKPISLTNILVPSAAAVVAVLLTLLVMLTQSASADITIIRSRLNITDQLLQQKLSQRQELAGKIAGLEKKISQAEVSRISFSAATDSLNQQKNRIILAIEVAIESLTSNITLNSIKYTDSILSINGRASDGKVAISYFRRLERSGRLGEVGMKNMSPVTGESVDFTLIGNFEKQGGVSHTGVVVNSLPDSITLTGVSATNERLTINGQSPNEGEILSYTQNLEASGQFSQITISRLTAIKDGEMEFSLVLNIKQVLNTVE
ncbi:MAG: PilN domain-containing protein [Chloroflexi bacterium]|nr:PilN domain-containing protein [Chloroflexota bacterium]